MEEQWVNGVTAHVAISVVGNGQDEWEMVVPEAVDRRAGRRVAVVCPLPQLGVVDCVPLWMSSAGCVRCACARG